MFRKLLIANRGEIACRVIRTARRLGIHTIAVYSDADRDALHVQQADESRRIGAAEPRASYLDGQAILAAARASGAQAIHPGYGFLSENHAFATACAEAGIVFVGPSPDAIAAMGDKSAAKRLMEKARVPLVPGYHGEEQAPAFLEKQAARIGFPVLIKPSAGGGGKGMRVVRDRAAFAAALEAARREAQSSFGDPRVLVERYLERPRHIEVQIFGDAHGNLVHLFERDCSVQRRHQKILEEAPAPGLAEPRRSEMGAAAVAAARAIGYTGAGTVEFIAEQAGGFYFMEMNTRLQVEHPVTEMITGLDLVEWQLLVAAGQPLPRAQEQVAFSGHAIEVRIYAEDPERDFLPATGVLRHLEFPAASESVRIDAGVRRGAQITAWYDPMIAKLIVHARDRPSALQQLRSALAQVEIAGVASNVQLLRRLASSAAFAAADVDTGFIEKHRAELLPPRAAATDAVLATAAFAEMTAEQAAARTRALASSDRYSPWHEVDGWRLNEDSHHDLSFLDGDVRRQVRIRFAADGLRVQIDGRDHALSGELLDDGGLLVRIDGHAFKARAVAEGAAWHIFVDGGHHRLSVQGAASAEAVEAPGSLAAPMPGKIVAVLSSAGARVSRGDPLVILEAMKMEHTITAPIDGVVKAIHYGAGEQVLEGAQLVELEA